MLGAWVGLICLGILTLVSELVLLQKLGYRQWWPLPILAASILGSFVMLWQGHVDSRIALGVYFVPVLILLFTKKGGDRPTAAGVEPKSLGTHASSARSPTPTITTPSGNKISPQPVHAEQSVPGRVRLRLRARLLACALPSDRPE